MNAEREAWVNLQLEKRGLTISKCDGWQYEPSVAQAGVTGHENGIEQAVSEMVVPLLEENEKLRAQIPVLIEYLDRQWSQGRFCRVTKYGQAVEILRALIVPEVPSVYIPELTASGAPPDFIHGNLYTFNGKLYRAFARMRQDFAHFKFIQEEDREVVLAIPSKAGMHYLSCRPGRWTIALQNETVIELKQKDALPRRKYKGQ